MGWFLKSNTKPKKKATPARGGKAATARAGAWDPGQTLAALRGFAVVVALAGAVVGWAYAERWLADHVGAARQAPPDVVLVDLPPWMDAALAARLRQSVALTVNPDPLDGDSLGGAVVAMEANPWVERVVSVRRGYGGQVLVSAEYRQPVALIEARDGYHLVDASGRRLLPAVYRYDELSSLGLPVVRGVASAPPAAGERWPGGDARAGLALATLLASQPYAHEVLAVDVTNHAGRVDRGAAHLVVPARGGGEVRWGRPPGEERFYEVDTETKLRHLSEVRRRHGSIDAGGRVVHVYTDRPMVSAAGQMRYTHTR